DFAWEGGGGAKGRGEEAGEVMLRLNRHGKRREFAIRHVVAPTLDKFQCAMLLEDDSSGFCMFLVDFAISSGHGRNKSIDVGHDVFSVSLEVRLYAGR